jgi:hypothetical protein
MKTCVSNTYEAVRADAGRRVKPLYVNRVIELISPSIKPKFRFVVVLRT